jgi:hypothetical protein
MHKDILDKFQSEFKNLSYEEKVGFYVRNFSTGAFSSGKLSNKLALISLICLVTKKLREKDGNLTVKVVIEKILQRPLIITESFDSFLIGLSIICEDFLYETKEIDNLGFTDSKQIIAKIKELLNEWFPF